MTIRNLLETIAAALILATVASCGGDKSLIDPKAMLAYGKEPSEQNLDALSKSYSATINKNRKKGPANPGIYSDYAVMLVKQGKRAEANGWFNKEMEAFPSSRGYVLQLKRRLIPEYQDNNSTSAADADTTAAEPDALSPTQRRRAEERAAAVLGDTSAAAPATNADPGTQTAPDTETEDEDNAAKQAEEPTPAETQEPIKETPDTETETKQ